MWIQFFLQNVHFAINLFLALTMFAVFWLYFDAWVDRKTVSGAIKISGFGLLSLSFLVHSAYLESSILPTAILSQENQLQLLLVTRMIGYVLVLIGVYSEPIQDEPLLEKSASITRNFGLLVFTAPFTLTMTRFIYPILAVMTGFLYLRRATTGLERHLTPLAKGFFVLSISELCAVSMVFRATAYVDVYSIVKAFGPIWIIEHIMLLLAALILARWVFGYLLKRFDMELFMIITSTIVGIFLITTVTFSALLLKNLQDESVRQLESNAKVLLFDIETKESELMSDAQLIAVSPVVISGISSVARKEISDTLEQFLLAKNISSIIVTSETGQVIARGEDREKIGDSLSDNALVKRALMGQVSATVDSVEGVVSPQLFIQTAAPIKDGQTIIGTVLLSFAIDSAYVDGVKQGTGLEASLYGDRLVSATTLYDDSKRSRLIGIKETNTNVIDRVLMKGLAFSGEKSIVGVPYFVAIEPLKNVDNNTVGMVLVARPQISVLSAAGQSIEMTFVISVLLIIVSIVPSYAIARFLSDQI